MVSFRHGWFAVMNKRVRMWVYDIPGAALLTAALFTTRSNPTAAAALRGAGLILVASTWYLSRRYRKTSPRPPTREVDPGIVARRAERKREQREAAAQAHAARETARTKMRGARKAKRRRR